MKRRALLSVSLALLISEVCAAGGAFAQSSEDFYRGKTINLIVSAGAGGGYDIYGRTFAQHYSRHIPGSPTIVVQNITGAGGLKAAQYLYSVAPKDGTVIALIQSTAVMSPFLGTNKDAPFDPQEFSGSMWVLRESGSGTRSTFEVSLARLGINANDLDVAIELPSNECVRMAVEAGVGATVISELVVSESIGRGNLHKIRLNLPARPFQAVRHRERNQSNASKEILNLIVDQTLAPL